MRQRIDERTRGRVIRLSGSTQQREHSRETNKKVERRLASQQVQVPRARGLRRKDTRETFPLQFQQHAVVKHECRVNDTTQRRQLRSSLLENAGELIDFRYVGVAHQHFCALAFKLVKHDPCFSGWSTSSDQNEMPRAVFKPPTDQLEADTAERTAD